LVRLGCINCQDIKYWYWFDEIANATYDKCQTDRCMPGRGDCCKGLFCHGENWSCRKECERDPMGCPKTAFDGSTGHLVDESKLVRLGCINCQDIKYWYWFDEIANATYDKCQTDRCMPGRGDCCKGRFCHGENWSCRKVRKRPHGMS